MNYFITYQGRTIGPMSIQQVMAYNVDENTSVCSDSGEWAPLFSYPELQEALAEKRRNSNYSTPEETYPSSGKDKVGTAVLAILLGTLGIQYFYLGKTTAGLLSILISFCTCGAWNLVCLAQGIVMLTMSQQEFDQKFVYTDKTFPLF